MREAIHPYPVIVGEFVPPANVVQIVYCRGILPAWQFAQKEGQNALYNFKTTKYKGWFIIQNGIEKP